MALRRARHLADASANHAANLARSWIAWTVSSVGDDHGHHRDIATQKCKSASISSGDRACCGMRSGLCSSSPSSCSMCSRGPCALCENSPDVAAAPGASGTSPGCTPLAWKATSSPLSLSHGALASPGNVDLSTAQRCRDLHRPHPLDVGQGWLDRPRPGTSTVTPKAHAKPCKKAVPTHSPFFCIRCT